MSISAKHALWAYQEQLVQWRAQGLDRYEMKEKLYEEYNLTVGVDSIRSVLEGTTVAPPAPAVEAAPAVPRPMKPKAGGFYPCGRPVEISNRNNKAHGWVAGEPKPCECLLCGPVEARIRKWSHWCGTGHSGNYLCVGVRGITFGCDEVRFCAGPSPDQMICRECFGLPPVRVAYVEPQPIKRGR